jgi:hypothetical protein
MRAIGRSVATAVLAGLVGAACVALFYAWHPAIAIDFQRELPTNLSGVYPAERDPASRLAFAWTAGAAILRLPGLDRRVAWRLDLRIRGARQLPADNPDVTVLADGAPLETFHSTTDFSDVHIIVPARPARRGLVLGLTSSKTFVPGPSDPRPLGVMLNTFVLAPEGIVLVPRPALAAASLSAAAMGAAIALLGVTAGSAIGGGLLVSAGTAAIAARGFGPFTEYPTILLRVGVWIAIALAGFSLASQRARGRALRNTARFAAAFSAAALFLKLIVLLHPDMPIGDAMFHAHRFQGVLGGRLYFTSVAPGGYAFPYPPGLYVFAAAFSGLVHRGAGDVMLLRIVTASVDAAAGLLLYWIAARIWDNRLAGAMAVAIYHLTPLNFAVLTTGNLTNAFAQSLAVAALALMAAPTLALKRWTTVLLLSIVLVAAFLSHTSTLAILFAASIAIAALFLLRRERSLRSSGAAIALAAIGAALVAFFAYYAYFMDTYRLELARIGRETAAAAPAAGGRTIADRLRFVPYALSLNIGAPVMLFAFLGAAQLALRPHVDRLALVLAGWLAACAAFLVIGVLTPIDMRYYLAALPALAIAAGYGAARAWNDGWPPQRTVWRVIVAGLLAAAISVGFHHWWSALG